MSSLGTLRGHRVVPVIVIDDASVAVDVAGALARGGVRCAEVTLRTEAAFAAIEAMASVPDFTVGAGTVISPEHVDAAVAAGATFVVSPGWDDDVVDAALSRGIGVLPGAATASEAMRAVRRGLDAVKFFPADRLGGLESIRALRGPFPRLGFVPSGGVTPSNIAEYLADPGVPAVSGSWLASRSMIAARDFAGIERATAQAANA